MHQGSAGYYLCNLAQLELHDKSFVTDAHHQPSNMPLLQSLRRRICTGLLGLAIVTSLSSCGMVANMTELRVAASPHLKFGNPSDAAPRLDLPNNFLMIKPQFALSYSRDRGTANWVSWQLNENWLGETERRDNFRSDPDLPTDWPVIVSKDYRDRRYDRGHIAPSGDRTASREDNDATFVFSNIMPQVPGNNRGPWNELEGYCRRLVRQGKELYIIAGPLGQKGRIGQAQLVVPRSTWKVILVLEQPGGDDWDVSTETRVIAVNIPNVPSAGNRDWQEYRITVDELEELTGYDFLSVLDNDTEREIESRIDDQ